jgi:hypothetical protein
LFPLINLYTSNNPLKAITTIVLIVGIISYTTGGFPLAFAFELSTPNKTCRFNGGNGYLEYQEKTVLL